MGRKEYESIVIFYCGVKIILKMLGTWNTEDAF